MSRLDLRFLGPPEVWRDQESLTFPTRKTFALLVYLAMSEGWHSREMLIALLWPESETKRGQASLRNTLSRLRRALGEAGSYLLVESDRLRFDLSANITLDWQKVAEAAATEDMAALQQVVSLYRGDLLEGFSLPDTPAFDDWAGLQREYWHRQFSDMLARLCRSQIDAALWKEGLATALRWTAHDPLNEAAHRHLIELYALAGNKTAALQAYDTFRNALATELAFAPSPETEALVAQIRVDQPGDRGVEAMTPPLSRSPAPRLPFTGRSGKHLQLVTAFFAARQGQTRIVLIEGEAGIGKTRLASEFLAWAGTRQADVLRGRALEAGGRLPYQPVIDALRPRVEQENAPEDLLSDVWLAELSRLLPELRERYPDLPPTVDDPGLSRTRLPEVVTRLGQALADRRQPLIIFVDDVQWADTASLDLLHYCSRAWMLARAPILLLLALRPETSAASPALHQWLANLKRDLPVQHQQLAPLTEEDSRQLARTLLNRTDVAGRAAASRLGEWLFAQTGGQPFFIHETLNELVGRGVLQSRLDPAGRWTMDLATLEAWLATGSSMTPEGVRQLITTRLNRLTPTASVLLTAATVLGRHCSFAQLQQVANLDEAAGLPALDELLAARLLIERDDARQPYAVAHDKIREVVYDEAGTARRRLFHRRAFDALERDAVAHADSGRQAAELAYHALGAHLAEPALRYSQIAGDEALRLFAIHDAIIHYEQAHALSASLQSAQETADLYLNLGRAYELAGNLNKSEAIYQELYGQARSSGQVELTCTALNRLATVAVHAYDFEMAVKYLEQAIQLAGESHNVAGLAEAEWGLAQLYHHRYDFQRSLLHSERTLALARDLEDEALVAGSLNALAYAQMFLGRVREGEATMSEARNLFATLGNKALEADSLTAIAATRIWQGDIQGGIAAARAAAALCEEIDSPWGHIYSRVWLATGLLDSGDYEAALAVAQAGYHQARAHDLPPMNMLSALVLGQIYRALGQPAAALEAHQEAWRINERVKSEIHTGLIGAELVADYALAGNWEEATSHARETLAHRNYEVLPLIISPRWLETEARLRGGQFESAQEDVRRWGEVTGRVTRYRVGHLRSLAVLALWEGYTGQAITYLHQALTLAEHIGLAEEQWQIGAKLYETYRAVEQRQDARQALDKAAGIIRTLAARIKNDKLKQGFLAQDRVQSILGIHELHDH